MFFNKAISIGSNCQSRFNISRTLLNRTQRLNKGITKNYDYGSYFFDWSVTPIKSCINILQNEFQDILMWDNLEIIQLNEKEQTVLDKATGCTYPHSFPNTQIGKCNYQLLKDSYPEVKKKMDYLIEKTKKTICSDMNLLFVLTGNHAVLDLKNLGRTIDNYRNSENYKILYTPWVNKVNFDESLNIKEDKRFIVRPITHEVYPGHFPSWDDAFNDIKLDLPYLNR